MLFVLPTAKPSAASTKAAVRTRTTAPAISSPTDTQTSANRLMRRALARAPLHALQCATCDSRLSSTSVLLDRRGVGIPLPLPPQPPTSRKCGLHLAPSPPVNVSIQRRNATTMPSDWVGR